MLIGVGQMLMECGEPRRNLERAREMIRRAAGEGCEIVVLPECLDFGWTFPGAREHAEPVPGPHSAALAEEARACGLYVVAGLVEGTGDRLYNSAVLVSPAGELLLKHRKINELDIARDLYSTGTTLAVAETPLGMLGVTICADNFPETLEIAGALARKGCRLLLSPCAWAVDADHDNERDPYGALWLGSYTTLAERHGMTVVGVSSVGWLTAGPWQGRKCIGCSLAVGPGGVLARGPYGEAAESLTSFRLPV